LLVRRRARPRTGLLRALGGRQADAVVHHLTRAQKVPLRHQGPRPDQPAAGAGARLRTCWRRPILIGHTAFVTHPSFGGYVQSAGSRLLTSEDPFARASTGSRRGCRRVLSPSAGARARRVDGIRAALRRHSTGGQRPGHARRDAQATKFPGARAAAARSRPSLHRLRRRGHGLRGWSGRSRTSLHLVDDDRCAGATARRVAGCLLVPSRCGALALLRASRLPERVMTRRRCALQLECEASRFGGRLVPT